MGTGRYQTRHGNLDDKINVVSKFSGTKIKVNIGADGTYLKEVGKCTNVTDGPFLLNDVKLASPFRIYL